MTKKLQNKDNPVKNLPRNLKKVAEYIIKHEEYDTIKQVCEELDLNYASVCTQIYNYNKKNSNYYDLLLKEINKNNAKRLIKLDKAVYQGALNNTSSLDAQAAKLFYQRMGALDTGSGGDRTQVNVNVLTVASPISPEQPVDIQVERQKIEQEED